jgi:hypothetical protein
VTAFSLQEILLIKKIIYSLDAVKCRLICWGLEIRDLSTSGEAGPPITPWR